MIDAAGRGNGRLAIIAGGGMLPVHVAAAARAAGEDPFIFALKNEADRTWHGFDHLTLDIGNFAGLQKAVNQHGIGRVVLSGHVAQRPEWRDVRPTIKILLRMPEIIRNLMSAGDDKILRMVISLIEAAGCTVIGAQDIAPGLLTRTGPLGNIRPSDHDAADIAQALVAARELGKLDIGQGAVSLGGRVVALEGAEGTDQMLERVAALRLSGRISRRKPGVLVKMCKPQQDPRADLPSIGVMTVKKAKAAGLAGIAVEAGRSFILDEAETIAAANAAGLFICGVDRGLESEGWM